LISGLHSALSLGLLFASTGLAAQNPSPSAASAPKYRTNFVIYNVKQKKTTTLFAIDGEWHAPNFTPDGMYLVSDSFEASFCAANIAMRGIRGGA
jgi:hypothetical protein